MSLRKYRNVPTEVDGIKFASKREAHRYCELKLLERAGKIWDLKLQPRYPLTVKGTKIGEYRGDFEYFDEALWAKVCEDVKGVETDLFKWKRRHFEAEYDHELEIVK